MKNKEVPVTQIFKNKSEKYLTQKLRISTNTLNFTIEDTLDRLWNLEVNYSAPRRRGSAWMFKSSKIKWKSILHGQKNKSDYLIQIIEVNPLVIYDKEAAKIIAEKILYSDWAFLNRFILALKKHERSRKYKIQKISGRMKPNRGSLINEYMIFTIKAHLWGLIDLHDPSSCELTRKMIMEICKSNRNLKPLNISNTLRQKKSFRLKFIQWQKMIPKKNPDNLLYVNELLGFRNEVYLPDK